MGGASYAFDARDAADRNGGFPPNPNSQFPSGRNDAYDAYRHAYTSAVITGKYNFGEIIAKILGDKNEEPYDPNGKHKGMTEEQYNAEKNMDLWNNNVGREEYKSWKKATEQGVTNDPLDKWIYDRVKDGTTINDPSDPRQWREPGPDNSTGSGSFPGGHGPDSPFGTPDAPRPGAPRWFDPFGWFNPPPSPLVLDLDGDGVEIVSLDKSKAFFDLDVNGFAELTAWVKGDDGFLAFDRNGNGRIDDRTELFGALNPTWAQFANGFTELAKLNTNGDGRIDAQDAAFGSLRIWRDLDGDGLTDEGELQTLAQAGITSINLAATYVNQTRGDSWISHAGTFTRGTGPAQTTGKVEDVWFDTNPLLSQYKYGQPVTLSLAVSILPELKGYGVLPNLRVAMQERPDLLATVKALVVSAATKPQAQVLADIEAALWAWAGVDGVSPTSRGTEIDARKLVFMEKLYGTPWLTWPQGNRDPEKNAAAWLEAHYDTILASLTAKILVQLPMATLLDKIVSGAPAADIEAAFASMPFLYLAGFGYDAQADRIVGDLGDALNALVAQAGKEAAQAGTGASTSPGSVTRGRRAPSARRCPTPCGSRWRCRAGLVAGRLSRRGRRTAGDPHRRGADPRRAGDHAIVMRRQVAGAMAHVKVDRTWLDCQFVEYRFAVD